MYYWVDVVDLGSCLESIDNLWKSHVLEKPHFLLKCRTENQKGLNENPNHGMRSQALGPKLVTKFPLTLGSV